MDYRIVKIDERNIAEHPQLVCFINPKHPAYNIKVDWLKSRLNEGLTIKLLYVEDESKPVGFIEYVPGEYAWRAVSAKDYVLIHCIWIYSNLYKNKGVGTKLLNTCIEDAKEQNFAGVAVVTSTDAFMAKKAFFIKNGFQSVDNAPPHHELLLFPFKEAPLPKFNDWRQELNKYQGLNIIYADQCPWVARFMSEVQDFVNQKGIALKVTKLVTSAQAQQAPSPYAVFCLINNGKLLADHYISQTRFTNILKKEKLILGK